MRRYIRHPSDMPIEIVLDATGASEQLLRDVSLGGLCFRSADEATPGSSIRLRVPLMRPPFEATARVVWCQKSVDGYLIGAEFTKRSDLMRARMVEQVCYIEHYRNEVRKHEGRELDSNEAAREWIEKYAADFPHLQETS